MRTGREQVDTQELKGLELHKEQHASDPTSFSILSGFDLYTEGAIRKSLGLPRPDMPMRVIGLSFTGQVCDIETGEILGQAPEDGFTVPQLCVVPGQGRNIMSRALVATRYLVFRSDSGVLYRWDGVHSGRRAAGDDAGHCCI